MEAHHGDSGRQRGRAGWRPGTRHGCSAAACPPWPGRPVGLELSVRAAWPGGSEVPLRHVNSPEGWSPSFRDCYGLNVCAPPIHTLKSLPRCDRLWRWGLWEGVGPCGWGPREWVSAPIRRDTRQSLLLSLPREDAARRGGLQASKWALSRHGIHQCLTLDFRAPGL